jgi:plasmid stability protein
VPAIEEALKFLNMVDLLSPGTVSRIPVSQEMCYPNPIGGRNRRSLSRAEGDPGALWRYTCAMATIQIRELPEETYETIRRRARAAGQSIQAYMRDQVIEFAGRRTKDEAWAAIESALAAEDSPGSSLTRIVHDLAADRR